MKYIILTILLMSSVYSTPYEWNNPNDSEWAVEDLLFENFDGYNGVYGGYLNGGRYGLEIRLPQFETVTLPVTFGTCIASTHVGPVPPRFPEHCDPKPVNDSGSTLLLVAISAAIGAATVIVTRKLNNE